MKYPIGIQNFESLRTDGFVYVDKTALIYELAQRGRYYFLSRPRRFGKSLLVSTLDSYFSGRRDLFRGLALERLEQEWDRHPVLRVDMNASAYDKPESVEIVLTEHLTRWEAVYGSAPAEVTPELRFQGVIRRACEQTGRRVVILVDEYDKPLLQTVDKPELHEHFRNAMKAFYGMLKTQDQYIRFAFLTGVTKFGHVSVFSDLNNLDDISMDMRYVNLCGVSEAELHDTFGEAIRELGEACGMTYEETCAELKARYDGYHFCKHSMGIYNPFSLLNTFDKGDFRDYWFSSGTPTFLISLLKRNDYELSGLQGIRVSPDILASVDSMMTNPVPVLYQSGYLTIKGYDDSRGRYILDYPNREVEQGFVNCLVPYFTPLSEVKRDSFIDSFVDEVEMGRPEDFMRRLQALFADGDYRIAGKMEIYFQNALHSIFKMLGFYTQVERATAQGRMDIVIQTKDYIYIMEIKLDGTAEAALRQIKEKQYALPFRMDPRTLYIIGVNFSSATRGIEKWIIEWDIQ